MVGGLVQQQQVGFFQKQAAERHTPAFAAGEFGHVGVRRGAAQGVERNFDAAVEVPAILGVDFFLQGRLFGEKLLHLVVFHGQGEAIGDFVEAGECRLQRAERLGHVFRHGFRGIEIGLLAEIADAGAFGREGLAAVFGFDAGDDFQQGRLTGAVDAEHADLHAGQKAQRDAFEHLAPARIGLGEVLHHIDILIAGHGQAPNASGGGGV